MKNENLNSHETCKAMRNAALKQLLADMKEMDINQYSHELFQVFISIENILDTYECIPCECLSKRVYSLRIKLANRTTSKSDIKAFIAELETFLDLNNTPEITIKDNSSYKI